MATSVLLLVLLSAYSIAASSDVGSLAPVTPSLKNDAPRFRELAQMQSTALTTAAGGVVCGSAGSTQLNCPHDNGVCCPDDKSCCPSDFQCVQSAGVTQCRQISGTAADLDAARKANEAENSRRATVAQQNCAAAGGSCSSASNLPGGGGALAGTDLQEALTPVKIIHQAPPPPKITIMPTIIIQHKPADLAAWQAANAAKCAGAGGAVPSVPLSSDATATTTATPTPSDAELSKLLTAGGALNAPLSSNLNLPASPFSLLEKAEALTEEETTARADAFLARVDTVKTAQMISRLKRAGVHSTILDKIVERAKAQGRNVNEIKEMVAEDAFEDAHDPPDVDQAIRQIDQADTNLQKFSEQRSAYAPANC